MDRHRHGHFGWVDLMADDVEAQSVFYEDLFGWTHHDEPTSVGIPYRIFAAHGLDVAGCSPLPPDMRSAGVPTMWNAYVIVDDADAAASRAVELGGRVTMPAMDVMDSGRMVGITDPVGANIFLWQPRRHPGAQLYDAPGALTYCDLNARESAPAADFYEALFGWEVDRSGRHDPNYWGFSVEGAREGGIMLMPPGMPEQTPAHWLVYFGAEDAGGLTARVPELGGRIVMEPMDIGVAVFSVASDPAGAIFGIMQRRR